MQIANKHSRLERTGLWVVIVIASLSCGTFAAETADPINSAGDDLQIRPAREAEQTSADVPGQQDEFIEEITVTGQRLIVHLRMEVIRAEDRAFDLFNELNDDHQYDIHCRMEAPTGTRIRYRQCAPNFYIKTEAHATQTALSGGYMETRPILAAKYEELKEQMKKKVLEHPELLDAFLQAQELRKELGYTITSYWDRKARTP